MTSHLLGRGDPTRPARPCVSACPYPSAELTDATGPLMKTLAKLPVTIVTGFLGAGKTTLLRHLLANAGGRRIAVIVNEFGELGIDGEILKQCSIGCSEEEANGRVFELANGCLCCTVQEEFFPVMRELVARRGDLDHILIETSGLALPKPLVQAFNWPEIRNACTVDAVITVVDSPAVLAGTFAAFPDQVDEQRKLDPNLDHESPLHELFADQLASADLVILNKADLLDAEALAAVRAEVAEELPPAVKVIEAHGGELPLDVLLGLNSETELHIDSRRTHHDDEDEDHDHEEFDSFHVELPEAEEVRLLAALKEAVAKYGSRVSLVLKADIRPGHTGELSGKVERLERAIDEMDEYQGHS